MTTENLISELTQTIRMLSKKAKSVLKFREEWDDLNQFFVEELLLAHNLLQKSPDRYSEVMAERTRRVVYFSECLYKRLLDLIHHHFDKSIPTVQLKDLVNSSLRSFDIEEMINIEDFCNRHLSDNESAYIKLLLTAGHNISDSDLMNLLCVSRYRLQRIKENVANKIVRNDLFGRDEYGCIVS